MVRPKPWDVDGELWAVIEPLLSKIERRTRHPGRKRHPDRLVFQGILFVLHTGIAWEHLPQGLGFGPSMACWRRLAEWTEAGVRPRLHEVLLAKLRSANALGFFRAAVDGSRIRASKGAPRQDEVLSTGAEPAASTIWPPTPLTPPAFHSPPLDRRQPKRRHLLIPLLQAVSLVQGKRGRPRCHPDVVLGDRGYDHDKCRRLVWDLDDPRHRHALCGEQDHLGPPSGHHGPGAPAGEPRQASALIIIDAPHPHTFSHVIIPTARLPPGGNRAARHNRANTV